MQLTFFSKKPKPKWVYTERENRWAAALVQSTLLKEEMIVDIFKFFTEEEYFKLCLQGKAEDLLLELWFENL